MKGMRVWCTGALAAVLSIAVSGCAPFWLRELDFPSDRDNFFHVVGVNFELPDLASRSDGASIGRID